MALQFQPPPDWLIQEYMNRKHPVAQAAEGAQGMLGLYTQLQAQQQNQAIKQRQADLLASKEAREGRQQFYDYGDTGSLPPEVQASIGQPAQGPVTEAGVAPQVPGFIDRYNKFLEANPYGLKGQQFTEDTVLQKDEKGNIIGQSTFKRPIKGKTLMTGPQGTGQQYNMDKPQQVPGMTAPDGTPLMFIPSQGYVPAPVAGGIKPVNRKGDESSIGDANLIVNQIGNVDKLFDAYKKKSTVMGGLQATGVGGVLDPETKQIEDSLKLTAFSYGGKNLTQNEKEIVYGAFFPKWYDAKNPQVYENKRKLLKGLLSGKIDLMEAANLLGPSGDQIKQMLQKGQGTAPKSFIKPGEESEYEAYKRSMAGGR